MFYGLCSYIKTIYILWMIIISIAHKIWLVKCAYKGEKYIRCADCGVLVKNTNGKRRYCKGCADIVDKEKARMRMQKLREK